MKTFLLTVLTVFMSWVATGQNRIATDFDRKIYGDYIEPGDLIIDTPTRVVQGKPEVIYYFMMKQWPGLREGATIWLDGAKLGVLREIKFCNTSESLTPWQIESATFRNIPDTQVVASSFVCQGLKHFELDGESLSFPGLSSWFSSGKFLTGSFGFHMIGNLKGGGFGYSVSVRDGGSIRFNGFEAQYGFAGLRISGGNYDLTVESIEITNFYIHDTCDGEGQYLGATHKPPLAKLKNLKIHHGIIARTAAEALQLQHLVGGTEVHHITIFAADVRWINEFMAWQDTGIQWSVDAGANNLHHIIVDGFSSVGLTPFGSSEKPTGGVSRVHHVLFNDGRDTGMYLHNSTSFGIHWIFDNLYFRGFNAPYYQYTGLSERNYFISRKFGSDKFTFDDIFHDGSKPKVFQDTSGIEVGKITQKKLPPPVYMNSGFYEPANRIKQWHPYYGPYFPISRRDTVRVEVATQWDAGDIAIETLGSYSFYKCVKTHTSSDTRPGMNPFFIRLSWDAKGVRNDQPGWDPRSSQSDLPPDDLRLEKNSYWRKLGFGFQEVSLNEAAR